ncbi:MAG TPA: ATPase domain-containing protein [Bryobacteraceae bacterium]
MSGEFERVSTGVPGLDDVMRGGAIARRSYMVRGGPGAGKTILGLHFLNWAAVRGEKTLFITFGESEDELRRNGSLLGFSMDKIAFLDLSPSSTQFAEGRGYDIFPPSEVEGEPITQRIRDEVSSLKPVRVFVDGMTQLRYLASSPYQFRKEALAFLRFLRELGATVLFTSESNDGFDEDLQFIADGVIYLELAAGRRRAAVVKYRGSDFRAGFHTLRLSDHGMQIFPRLLPDEFSVPFEFEQIPFGLPELDSLTHGGLERGTITIITGPSGVGKTTLGMQFAHAAAERGERSVVYLFEEWRETMLRRCESINIPVLRMMETGNLSVVHVEPLRFTADEFALMVRHEVEQKKARIVMIDSISGYRLSLHDQDLVTHLHALAKYLQNMGVAVLLINEVEGITGDFRITDVGVSYISDNIIFLRYLEVGGEITKALGVLKKRLTDFEKTLRGISITSEGIRVGEKLTRLHGILSGVPDPITGQAE